MTQPRILIVIEHEPADQYGPGPDGRSEGAVRGVHSNLPGRYFDIVIREWEVTKRDKDGTVSQSTCDTEHPRGDVPFKVPTDPPEFEDSEEPPFPQNVQEWGVTYFLSARHHTALVLKAPDAISAAQRVVSEFPLCRIVRVEQYYLEEDSLSYLDNYDVILPVGGPRLPRSPDTKQ